MMPKKPVENLEKIKTFPVTELKRERKCLICNGTGIDPTTDDVNDGAMPEGKYRVGGVRRTPCRACKGSGRITLLVKQPDPNGRPKWHVIYDRYIDRNGALLTFVKPVDWIDEKELEK